MMVKNDQGEWVLNSEEGVETESEVIVKDMTKGKDSDGSDQVSSAEEGVDTKSESQKR